MNYAVVQDQLTKPDPKALEVAFRALGQLVDIDAATLSDDGYGIVASGLAEDEARRLAEAITAAGVTARVVDEAEFPLLVTTFTDRQPRREAKAVPVSVFAFP